MCPCSVREMAARLLGIVTMALSADSASGLLGQLAAPQDKSSKFESNEGHLAAAGFVLAQLLMGMPDHPPHSKDTPCHSSHCSKLKRPLHPLQPFLGL